EGGRRLFMRLVADADVLLEGFRPGVTQRLRVDYETLSAHNPRLIYAAITGYGQNGPYRDRVGHDVNYLGYAGVLNFIGNAGAPPVIPGGKTAKLGARASGGHWHPLGGHCPPAGRTRAVRRHRHARRRGDVERVQRPAPHTGTRPAARPRATPPLVPGITPLRNTQLTPR